MVIEIGGSRIISSHLGSSIYVWASTISFVLVSLSIGYYIGGKIARRNARSLWVILAIAGISTSLLPFLGGQLMPLTRDFSIELASVFAGLLLAPPSVLYGMVSPMITGIMKKSGNAAGRVFGISTLGSIFGVILTGLVMVRYFPLSQIFFGTTLLMIAASALSFYGGRR
jgi:hypothetical protein